MFMMHEDGIEIGSFKVRKLMSEMKVISKQPGSYAYKRRRWSGRISAGSYRSTPERHNEKTRQKAGFTGVPEILVAFAGT